MPNYYYFRWRRCYCGFVFSFSRWLEHNPSGFCIWNGEFKCETVKSNRACLISMSEPVVGGGSSSGDDEIKIIARRARFVGGFNHQHSAIVKCAASCWVLVSSAFHFRSSVAIAMRLPAQHKLLSKFQIDYIPAMTRRYSPLFGLRTHTQAQCTQRLGKTRKRQCAPEP